MNLFIELLLVRYSLNIRYLVKISIFGFLFNPFFSSQYIFKLITYFDNMTEKYFPTLFFFIPIYILSFYYCKDKNKYLLSDYNINFIPLIINYFSYFHFMN